MGGGKGARDDLAPRDRWADRGGGRVGWARETRVRGTRHGGAGSDLEAGPSRGPAT